MNQGLLKKIGFSDKSAQVYLRLLQLGPSSVRALAEDIGLNRGTTYDALKSLQDQGVVSFYKKDSKQHFVAEDPKKLRELIHRKQKELDQTDTQIKKMLPELQALHHSGGDRPIAKYFDKNNLKAILEDVLNTTEQAEKKEYYLYSVEGIRDHVYKEFPSFSDARIAKGISVKVIAIGDGGELRGLDERRWINTLINTPTYIIIYPGKTAYISLNAKLEAVGVIIENTGIYETQRTLFEALWSTLTP